MLFKQKSADLNKEPGYISASDLFFLAVFSALLIIHCIGNTSLIYQDVFWMDGMYVLKKLLYLILLIKLFFFSSYQEDEIIRLLIVFLIAFGSCVGSRNFDFLELFLLAIAARKINPRMLVTCFMVIKGTAVVATILLWRIGVLPALYYWNSDGYYNTFGFCHKNVLGSNIAFLCLAWFFLRYKKMKFTDVLLWFGIGNILYRFSYSRSGVIMVVLISLGMYLFRRLEDILLNIQNMRTMISGAFLLLLLASLLCMFFYSPSSSFWVTLDRFFTTRVQSVSYFYHEYGFSLFGQDIMFVSTMEAQLSGIAKLILDNSYIRVILYYGLIPAVMFFYVYLKVIRSSFDRKDGAVLAGLFFLAVYGVSERYMLDVYYQFPFLIAFRYLKKTEKNAVQTKITGNRLKFTMPYQRKVK